MKSRTLIVILTLLLVLTGCRRDLWVYTDDLHQVRLLTDWSEATEKPGGMTWWFISEDGSGRNYHSTTANVTSSWLGLPQGLYEGIVFDYSPAEYAHQEFVGMDKPESALVHLLPAADQPRSGDDLYGANAVPDYLKDIAVNSETGMYIVSAEPEVMNADTLRHQNIVSGLSEDHILWDERDQYQSQLVTQTINAKPLPIVWQLKVRVAVKGIMYMNSVRATIAGLTDGCWLIPMRHTSTPCLQLLDSWSATSTSDSTGYIATTVHSFGLPDPEMPASPLSVRGGTVTRGARATETHDYDDRLRLNIQFLLRDQSTVLSYHFDISEECVTIDENRLVVNIDLPIDYPGSPDLPFVDAKGTAGFDANVTPWEDGGTADTTM